MRILDFDALVGVQPVSASNPFIVQWKVPGSSNSMSLLGDNLAATVSGTVLTGLTGTRITQV